MSNQHPQPSDQHESTAPTSDGFTDIQHRDLTSQSETNFRRESPWQNTRTTVSPTGTVTTDKPACDGPGRVTTDLGGATISDLCETLSE